MLHIPYHRTYSKNIKVTARTPLVQKDRRMFHGTPLPHHSFSLGSRKVVFGCLRSLPRTVGAEHLRCSHPACQVCLLSRASKPLPTADVDFAHQSWGCTTNFNSSASERWQMKLAILILHSIWFINCWISYFSFSI